MRIDVWRVHESITEDRLRTALDRIATSFGFCLCCGDAVTGVDGNAARRDCATCGAPAVYGATLIMNCCGWG